MPKVTVEHDLLIDLHWMARRYADGRRSYAPGLLNDHTETLINLGVPLKEDEGQLFARDGDLDDF